jgi:hypothetical protein
VDENHTWELSALLGKRKAFRLSKIENEDTHGN